MFVINYLSDKIVCFYSQRKSDQTIRFSLEQIEQPSQTPERYLQSVQLPIVKTECFFSFKASFLLFQSSSDFTLKHQMQFMQEQLQQMQNESELALNQMKILKEQLNVEVAARIDAQVRLDENFLLQTFAVSFV